MRKRSSTRQKDGQGLAWKVLHTVVPDAEEDKDEPKKNPAAVALGRLGGKKGGPARAKKLSAKKRAEIARKAAEARWKKRG